MGVDVGDREFLAGKDVLDGDADVGDVVHAVMDALRCVSHMFGYGGERGLLGAAVVIHLCHVRVDGQVTGEGVLPVDEQSECISVDLHVLIRAVLPHEAIVLLLGESLAGSLVQLQSRFPVEIEMRPKLDQHGGRGLHDDFALFDGAVGDQSDAALFRHLGNIKWLYVVLEHLMLGETVDDVDVCLGRDQHHAIVQVAVNIDTVILDAVVRAVPCIRLLALPLKFLVLESGLLL